MSDEHLILAGGGHTHALVLLRWAMKPWLKPKCLTTLVNRESFTLYSGMLPGLIAGKYKLDDCLINLDYLASKAGISFVRGEIIGVDLNDNLLQLDDRPSLYFDKISFDVGSETIVNKVDIISRDSVVPIRPINSALKYLQKLDSKFNKNSERITVIGSGFTAVEIAFALRHRWPDRLIQLLVNNKKLDIGLKNSLRIAGIQIELTSKEVQGPCILCTGNSAPKWLKNSQLPVDSSGRVLTSNTLQVINNPSIFAVGDCGVIQNNFRPPSGVWAVRAATPLAINLERSIKGLKLRRWSPQKRALQLLGANIYSNKFVAWAYWGRFFVGPNFLIGMYKEYIDRNFINMFQKRMKRNMSEYKSKEQMSCRGCAAKLPAKELRNVLKKTNLIDLATHPENASFIEGMSNEDCYVQSVDGFPAIISDPWLNGRLTALHACSDIWARGGSVLSAQLVISIPEMPSTFQQEVLKQSILGVQSVLEPQGANLIGGHSMEARDLQPNSNQFALGLQLSLSVNGIVRNQKRPWSISGMQPDDLLLISRGIGSGVIFAAAMLGEANPKDIDNLLSVLSKSQHYLLDSFLEPSQKSLNYLSINACTDITGFGLLGHLTEMLDSANWIRNQSKLPSLRIELYADSIPAITGAIDLIDKGFSSSFSPSNRDSFDLFLSNNNQSSIKLIFNRLNMNSKEYQNILELIFDPQTCGPLLISCPRETAYELINAGPWQQIGKVI